MGFIIFMIIIPVMAGIVSTISGLSVIASPGTYLLVNGPICLTSIWLWTVFERCGK